MRERENLFSFVKREMASGADSTSLFLLFLLLCAGRSFFTLTFAQPDAAGKYCVESKEREKEKKKKRERERERKV